MSDWKTNNAKNIDCTYVDTFNLGLYLSQESSVNLGLKAVLPQNNLKVIYKASCSCFPRRTTAEKQWDVTDVTVL